MRRPASLRPCAVGVALAASLLFALPDALAPTLVAGAGAALVVAVISASALTPPLPAGAQFTSARRRGRAPRSIAAGAIALVAAAAIVATWQLLTNGPLTTTRSESAEIDSLTLIAPGPILAAIVRAALFVFPLITRAAEAPAARGSGALTVLAVRGVARRAELAAVPIVMVGLSLLVSSSSPAAMPRPGPVRSPNRKSCASGRRSASTVHRAD